MPESTQGHQRADAYHRRESRIQSYELKDYKCTTSQSPYSKGRVNQAYKSLAMLILVPSPASIFLQGFLVHIYPYGVPHVIFNMFFFVSHKYLNNSPTELLNKQPISNAQFPL